MDRLQRILASRGIASRRGAEQMIRDGRVTVDGRVVTEMGTKADPLRSEIKVDGRLLRRQRSRYILLNKPRGYITTTSDERDRRTVLDLVQVSERVYPVGRLDRITEGLLLLTNDGDVANRIMHPRYGLDKEYEILTLSRPTDAALERVRKGMTIDGKRIVPQEFRIVRESRDGWFLKIVIHEGINHVVRRLMDGAGIPVERLRRVRIGPLSLAGIAVGTWRDMRPGEERTLIEALGLTHSNGEEDRLIDAARRGYGAPAGREGGRRPSRADRLTSRGSGNHTSPRHQSREQPARENAPKKVVDRRDERPAKPTRGSDGQRPNEQRGTDAERRRGRQVSSGDRDRRPSRGRQVDRRARRGRTPGRDAV